MKKKLVKNLVFWFLLVIASIGIQIALVFGVFHLVE